jgi:hypothetical protein
MSRELGRPDPHGIHSNWAQIGLELARARLWPHVLSCKMGERYRRVLIALNMTCQAGLCLPAFQDTSRVALFIVAPVTIPKLFVRRWDNGEP